MTAINSRLFHRPVSIAPLVSFRIIFGLLMFFSLLRFWWRGWISTVYIQPRFHFTYLGFEWVKPLGNLGMHLLFVVVMLSALCITLGFLYRLAAAVFFLGFTYIELIDVTTYLNHYYFISLVAFIMIWLPANRYYSIDCRLQPTLQRTTVPMWTIGILRFQMGVVYVFAGLAKLNADWLLRAEPMRTWLPAKTHLPLVGPLLYQSWVAYFFSWFGAVYDLFIVFFLLNKKTRPVAFCFVVVFHVATAIFFPGIGLFPYVMIACSCIFFSGRQHETLLKRLPGGGKIDSHLSRPGYQFHYPKLMAATVLLYVCLQVLVPLRFMLYPGHLFWTEEGYRFSWRVMLMEKSGAAYFTVRDSSSHQSVEVNNAEFLTALQEKMMSTQPDMILKYAHHLASEYKQRGMQNPAVYATIYVALNGDRSRLFADSSINLAAAPIGWKHYNWIIPYKK
ncbi:MAG TPA: HTTM domain-containing protein [Chitinophagaceae bacterium]|nr:HTTM domain-containing protein [Chitinophagaceae bacterium]